MPRLDRRSVIAGAVALSGAGAASALAGCSTGDDGDTAVPERRTYGQLTPDEQAVTDLVARLERTTVLLTGISKRYPLLGRDLAALLSTEKTHLVTLRRSVEAANLPKRTVTPAAVPGNRDAARVVAQQETTALKADYLKRAQAAESGQFARLLASMGCALSQLLPGLG